VKNYDSSFLAEESLAEILKEINYNFKIDLLLEEKVGFLGVSMNVLQVHDNLMEL
jgi:hypothetical protein